MRKVPHGLPCCYTKWLDHLFETLCASWQSNTDIFYELTPAQQHKLSVDPTPDVVYLACLCRYYTAVWCRFTLCIRHFSCNTIMWWTWIVIPSIHKDWSHIWKLNSLIMNAHIMWTSCLFLFLVTHLLDIIILFKYGNISGPLKWCMGNSRMLCKKLQFDALIIICSLTKVWSMRNFIPWCLLKWQNQHIVQCAKN